MVFPSVDYDNDAFTPSGGDYSFVHRAIGADMLRYTTDFGQTWAKWRPWENVTMIPGSLFDSTWWQGRHIMVQCPLLCSTYIGGDLADV